MRTKSSQDFTRMPESHSTAVRRNVRRGSSRNEESGQGGHSSGDVTVGNNSSAKDMVKWDEDVQQIANREEADPDSDVLSNSQIGSLVSYSINYMEQKTTGRQQSLAPAERMIDSESGDNSLIVERESEQGHSQSDDDDSIDSIHEEVDISQSEGSEQETSGADK